MAAGLKLLPVSQQQAIDACANASEPYSISTTWERADGGPHLLDNDPSTSGSDSS